MTEVVLLLGFAIKTRTRGKQLFKHCANIEARLLLSNNLREQHAKAIILAPVQLLIAFHIPQEASTHLTFAGFHKSRESTIS